MDKEEPQPYYDDTGTAEQKLGRKIYHEALSNRRGFRDDQLGIDSEDEIWLEIFQDIGAAALAALEAKPTDAVFEGACAKCGNEIKIVNGFVHKPTDAPRHAGLNLIVRREIDGQEMVCLAPWYYEQMVECLGADAPDKDRAAPIMRPKTAEENFEDLKFLAKLRAKKPLASQDADGLHSKIDMDIEDEIGRELTLEESVIVGKAIRRALSIESGGNANYVERIVPENTVLRTMDAPDKGRAEALEWVPSLRTSAMPDNVVDAIEAALRAAAAVPTPAGKK